MNNLNVGGIQPRELPTALMTLNTMPLAKYNYAMCGLDDVMYIGY